MKIDTQKLLLCSSLSERKIIYAFTINLNIKSLTQLEDTHTLLQQDICQNYTFCDTCHIQKKDIEDRD